MAKIGVLVLSLMFSIPAFPHDLFLRPGPFVMSNPGSTKLSMWIAEAFPGKQEKWRSDKTVNIVVHGPAGLQKIKDGPDIGPDVPLTRAGTYVIGWEATPSYIKIDAPTFQKYLEADGYTNIIQLRKQRGEENKEGTEKYVRYLKSLVQVGLQRTDHFKEPLGSKIELIPKSNPYGVKIGQPLEFLLLFDGKPLSGATIFATYEGFSKEHDVYAQTVRTGPDGTFKILIGHPGLWMVRANHMLPLSGDPKAEWESFWSNLTFEVPAK